MARLKDKFADIAKGAPGLEFDPRKADRPQLMDLDVAQVERDPSQPRTDLGDLTDLKVSIREHGIIQPLIVSPSEVAGIFRIIAGERRYTAARELGLETVPCVVRTVKEHRRLEVQIIENIHRKDFNPVEEAKAYERLIEEFNLSQRDLADRLGKSVATVNQTLRILTLPEDIVADVQTSERISRSVLLEIAKQESESAQRSLWTLASGGNLTVKEARAKKKGPAESERKKVLSRSTIHTKAATVTVTFERDGIAPSEIADALAEALRIAKAQARATEDSSASSEG